MESQQEQEQDSERISTSSGALLFVSEMGNVYGLAAARRPLCKHLIFIPGAPIPQQDGIWLTGSRSVYATISTVGIVIPFMQWTWLKTL